MTEAGSAPSRPQEVRLTDETIEFLEQRVADAVRDGITAAINPQTAEAFWAAALTVLQRRAQEHTGRFVLGGLWGLARKVSLFLLLGGFVYAVGGWQALAGFFKLLLGKV
jgi:hypothetical protein